MIKKVKHALWLHLYDPVFTILFGLFIFVSVGGRIFADVAFKFIPRKFYIMAGDDICTLLIVLGLWFPFVLGVHIKRQFANHRASLLPGYRSSHMFASFLFFVAFLSFGSLVTVGFQAQYDFFPGTIFWGVYVSFWLMTILVVCLGYLSITSLLYVAYIVGILVLANNQGLVSFLSSSLTINVFIAMLTGLLVLLLGWRLLKLKEDHAEYPYLISWPQKDLIQNQLRAREVPSLLISRLKEFFHIKKGTAAIPPYSGRNNLWTRARHWDHMELAELKALGIVVLLILPLYILYLKNFGATNNFFNKTYTNFLLFSVAPVLIVITANYNKMSYWGFDLLKPILRHNFIGEHGVSLMINLVLDWAVLGFLFAVLPKLVLDVTVLRTLHFWTYLLLTLSFAFCFLAWISVMGRIVNPKAIIGHGLFFSFMTTSQFMHASTMPTVPIMLFNSFVYFACGVVLTRVAYRRWCDAEF